MVNGQEGNPFGVCYQYDDVLKMKVLQFEKDKTKIIREIFKQYKGGLGFNSIAAYLNIHHPLSGQQWSKERAKSIITNPIYCGYLSIHKRKKDQEILQQIVTNGLWRDIKNWTQ